MIFASKTVFLRQEPNPIKAWLVRVAAECGSPENMLAQAAHIKHENTRKLITERAQLWIREIKRGNAR